MKNTNKVKQIVKYKNIQLRHEIYKINDSVSILQKDDEIGYAKILDIWQEKESQISFISVSWFYKPQEVFKTIPDFISEAELFDSSNIQELDIRSIIEKVHVLSLDDYHNEDEVDSNVFFTRAKFNHIKKTISPCLSQWNRVCYCESIINPDIIYNKCDKCLKCFHFECCEFSGSSDSNWTCQKCE